MRPVKHSLTVRNDGSIYFTVSLTRKRIKLNDACDCYMLASVEQALPVLVDCDGIKRKPTLILKLYCSVKHSANRIRKMKAIERLRSREQPLIY